MSAFGLGGVLTGVGAGLGGIAGALGGASANRAGRKSRDWYDRRTGDARNLLGQLAFGDAYFDLLKAAEGLSLSRQRGGEGEDTARQGFSDAMQNLYAPSSLFGQLRGLEQESRQRGAGIQSDFASSTDQLVGNRLGSIDRSQAAFGQTSRDAMNRYAGLEGLAQQFGRGREDIIRRDIGRQSQSAQDRAQAQLEMSGLGTSTVAPQVMGSIGREYAEAEQDALQNLSEAQIDRQMSARRGGIDSAFRADLAGALGLQSMLGELDSLRSTRAAQGTDLATQTLNRDIGLGQSLGVDPTMQLLLSGTFNPWLNQSTSQFYPGQSGAANALGTAGGTASALGGTMLTLDMAKKLGIY